MPLVVRHAPWTLSLSSVALGACGLTGPKDPPPAVYAGRETCARCHERESELFTGSHHDLAMQEASVETVLGDFSGAELTYDGVTSTFSEREGKLLVRTDGPDGELRDFDIAYTFGVEPLQQYLVPFPSGRLQALPIAWDARAGKWFHLHPGESVDFRDPLHWTKRLQNWNSMCAECHSTGVEKRYDLESDRYETTWAEIDVSCEACHGPGSRHVDWAEAPAAERGADDGLVVELKDDDSGIWVMDLESGLSKREPKRTERVEIETCARCHARRSSAHAEYAYGHPLLDTHEVALLTEPLYFADGQIDGEVYVYGSFLQSKMYREGVTCKDCHDPHRLSLRGEGNSACAACHLAEKFDAREHHHHEPGTAGGLCVSCHMPERTYIVVDPRRDHSFRVPRPDLTLSIGAPNACNACHRDEGAEWAKDALAEWFGGGEPETHYGVALDAGRRGKPGAEIALERLARDGGAPAIARATALSMIGADAPALLREAIADPDALVRLGALESVGKLPASALHQAAFPLLRDPVRSVRLAAARALASLPENLFPPEERPVLEAGLAEYRDAQLRNADWPESHVNLGLVALARGDLAEARRSFERALERDPHFSPASVNLADVYRLEGRDAEGEAVLRGAIEANPESAELHHALGLLLVRSNRKTEAVRALARAFELGPENPRYGYVYGVALESAGDAEGAIDVLEETLEHHPFDGDVLQALAAFRRNLVRKGTH
jgi:tetratricopeptide (TPR) repeat protein